MTASLVDFDGHRFHTIWLRDNCLCAECRHPSSFQKRVDLSDRSGPPRLTAAETASDALVLTWDEAPPHVSVFPRWWLQAHAYDAPAGPSACRDLLWDAGTLTGSPPPVHRLSECSAEGGQWADDLWTRGFAVFDGVDEREFERFVAGIGPVHHTEYGRFAPVRAVAGANDLAETGYALTPHTDYSTYMHTAPLLQFMYFVEHDSTGGETILVDGYRVAKDFRRDHPDRFRRLAATPVNHQQVYADWRYYLRRRRSVIELDAGGAVAGVYFGHSHACNWQLPFDEVEPYYDAYFAFFRYLKDPRYQFVRRLRAGECVAVRNARVLHGRQAFDPSSGGRYLLNAYVAWEHFAARARFNRDAALYGLT